MPEPAPLPGFSPAVSDEIELRPAKINDRFIAYAIDTVPFAAGYALTLWLMVLKLQSAPYSRELVLRVASVWVGLYFLYELVGNALGATVGKKLMEIRVVRKDGSPLGWARGAVRSFGYLLSTPMCNWGFLVALLHPESRAFHDLISGSLVIEPRRKNAAESLVLFVGAVSLLVAMYGGMIYLTLTAPTPQDRLAVEKAKDGLLVMAQIEEAYKSQNKTYTNSLKDLALASGDAEKFASAMSEIFEPDLFRLEAGNRAYRISASAKDRRKTRVTVEGPPAAVR